MRVFDLGGKLLVVALSLFMAGCGGGGGSSAGTTPAPVTATQYNAVARKVGDSWIINSTNTSIGNAMTPVAITQTTSNYVVDAVNPDNSYSLAALDATTNTLTSTALVADGGNTLVTQGCLLSSPAITASYPLYVGKSWTSSYRQSCNQSQTQQITLTGNVEAAEPITIVAGTYNTLRISRTKVAVVQDLVAETTTTNETCWWSIDLGMFIKCNETVSYSNFIPPPADSATLNYEMTGFTAGTGQVSAPVTTSYVLPALPQGMPLVGSLTNTYTVLSAPVLVPVFFADNTPAYTSNAGALPGFMQQLAASKQWGMLSEYGVGSASVAASVSVHTTFAATPTLAAATTSTAIATWLKSQLDTNAWGNIDPNSIVTLFLPAGVAVTMPNGSVQCTPGGNRGYHAYLTLNNSTKIAFAVIPDCGFGLDTITYATSHELFEAVTDPVENSYVQVKNDFSWSYTYSGSEIGDMCETRSDKAWLPSDVKFKVARFWSNLAAANNTVSDPCVGQESIPAAPVYFNSAPELPTASTLTITTANSTVTHPVYAATLDATTHSVSIPVHLFSNMPTNGVWRVNAVQAGLAAGIVPTLTFSWDKTTGQHGDTLFLTIQATTSLPNGAVFEINSYYGGVVTHWTGAVSG